MMGGNIFSTKVTKIIYNSNRFDQSQKGQCCYFREPKAIHKNTTDLSTTTSRYTKGAEDRSARLSCSIFIDLKLRRQLLQKQRLCKKKKIQDNCFFFYFIILCSYIQSKRCRSTEYKIFDLRIRPIACPVYIKYK